MDDSKPYHHGKLRETLLHAALELIREQGLPSLTLRELARRASVSHTAPYRHFKDKEQLLAALAASASKRLSDRISYYSLKGYSPTECFELGALAYLRFAFERPAEFQLIFSLDLAENPAKEVLESLATACKFPKQNPALISLAVWALIHGTAELARTAKLGINSRKETLEFAASSLRTLLAGFSI